MTLGGQSQNHRQWVLAALDEFEGRLTRYAARLLNDRDAAADVVQHAFLRLCDQPLDEIGDRVGPWLFTVCRNRVVDVARKNGRLELLEEHADGNGAARVSGREIDPAVAAESRDLADWLRTLVDLLPPMQREVVDLWKEGFSYREIAKITERTETNVRVIAHRAFKRLREHPSTQSMLRDNNDTLAVSIPNEKRGLP